MKISELGEFGLIRKLASSTKNSKDVVLGIGDDAAVLKYTKDKYLLLAADMLIEDVHFDLSQATAFQIGRKALAVNISDIAAMGGVPKYALISVGLPRDLPVRFAGQLYKGIRTLAEKYDIDIVGGDTDSSEKLVINIALTGEVEKKNLTTRKGAKPGDYIFVTGDLGGSIYSKHMKFVPRLKEARTLAEKFKPTAMIDVSDGLASDLTRVIEASDTGAVIYEMQIPVSQAALRSASEKKIKPMEAALYDGEDFELLFTISESNIGQMNLDKIIAPGRLNIKDIDIPVHCIGLITEPGSGLKIVDKDSSTRPLKVNNPHHF